MPLKKIILILLLLPIKAFSWSDHTFLTYYTLKNNHSALLHKFVKAETLQSFLLDMQKNHPKELKKAIDNAEQWAIKNMPGYHPIPGNIAYNESKVTEDDIVKEFLQGIRVNTNAFLFPFIRNQPSEYSEKFPGQNNLWDIEHEISYTQVTSAQIGNMNVPGLRYFKVDDSQLLPALVVLSTAADTPDLGLDIGLFEDNNTKYGQMYGFGEQPFGDNRVSYSSAAPFHYGAYHEWKLLYTLAPQTKDCYAEYRIKLYRELAKTAFLSGHNYWGWQFLGFGLHYIQDLTQAYHSHFFPGYNTLSILFYYGLSLGGYQKPLDNSIHLVANRHFLLEDFILKLLQTPTMPESIQLQNALAKIQSLESDIEYNDQFARNVISLHTMNYSEQLSNTLLLNFPKKYVNDPNFLYEGRKEKILNTFQSLTPTQQKNIMENLKPNLEYAGIYTRAYLRAFLE